jgi:large subunit ribosomal protein L35
MKGKTHKGLAKRLKKTASGKLRRGAAGKRHLMSTKSAKRRRRLSGWHGVTDGDRASLERQYGKL